MIGFKSNALIPFVMVGYPSLKASFDFARALIEEGASVLELGVPFSDPLADGPVIQKASQVALDNGVGLKEALQFAQDLKALHPSVPLVAFTYLNPLLRYGLEAYARDAVAAGIDATLTVDLPPEEALEYARIHREAGLKTVFLASPTTTPDRLRKIDEISTAFVYYVSRVGVTGEAQDISATLESELAKAREFIKQPIAVGFGVSTPEQAASVARFGDAVVIGSRFLRLMDEGEAPLRAFAAATVKALAQVRST